MNQRAQQVGYSTEETAEPEFPLGKTFRLKQTDNIRNLQPFEGDTILQARFGQSIRFGSTNILPQVANSRENVPVLNTWSTPQGEDLNSTNGDPITIILNEQGKRPESSKFDTFVEDVNSDGSSIYMTSTQILDFSFTNAFPLGSFKSSRLSGNTNLPQNTTVTNTTSTVNSSADSQDKSLRGNGVTPQDVSNGIGTQSGG